MRSEGEHDGRNILCKYMERKSVEKPRRTSPEFSLPSHQKEIRKKHCLRRAYPCSEKVKHVRISSTSGSTKYTSINDWKIHNGSSDHKEQVHVWISHIRLSMMLKDATDHWYQRLIPKGTNWTWWNRMVLHCKLRFQHIEFRHDWLQHIRWSGIN